MGTPPSSLTPRMCRVAANPSSCGICMSIIIKSGPSFSARSIACRPSAASMTRKPLRSSQVRRSSRVSSKSSTTRTVRLGSENFGGDMIISFRRGGLSLTKKMQMRSMNRESGEFEIWFQFSCDLKSEISKHKTQNQNRKHKVQSTKHKAQSTKHKAQSTKPLSHILRTQRNNRSYEERKYHRYQDAQIYTVATPWM